MRMIKLKKKLKVISILGVVFIFLFFLANSLEFQSNYIDVGSNANIKISQNVNYSGIVESTIITNLLELKWNVSGSGVQGKLQTSDQNNFSSIISDSGWFNINDENAESRSLTSGDYVKYIFRNTNSDWYINKVEVAFNSSPRTQEINTYRQSTGNSRIWYGVYDLNVTANISDPDGWDDIDNTTVSIINSSTTVLSQGNMTPGYEVSIYEKIYNYTYSILETDPSGIWNITIEGTDGNSGLEDNILVNVDTNYPTIQYESITPGDGDFIRGNEVINVSATDTGGSNLSSIIIEIYNSTGGLEDSYNCDCNQDTSFYCNYSWATYDFSDGEYTFNATVNDSADNLNYTLSRTVTLDNTIPTVDLTNPVTSGAYSTAINITWLDSDNLDSNLNISVYYSNNSGYDYSNDFTISESLPAISNATINKRSVRNSSEEINISFIASPSTTVQLTSCWANLTLEDGTEIKVDGVLGEDIDPCEGQPDTDWGGGPAGCTGLDQRCFNDSCIQCNGVRLRWENNDQEMYCWYGGDTGENCEDVCSDYGGIYDATEDYVHGDSAVRSCDWIETTEDCKEQSGVFSETISSCSSSLIEGPVIRYNPVFDIWTGHPHADGNSDCNYSSSSDKRACACNGNEEVAMPKYCYVNYTISQKGDYEFVPHAEDELGSIGTGGSLDGVLLYPNISSSEQIILNFTDDGDQNVWFKRVVTLNNSGTDNSWIYNLTEDLPLEVDYWKVCEGNTSDTSCSSSRTGNDNSVEWEANVPADTLGYETIMYSYNNSFTLNTITWTADNSYETNISNQRIQTDLNFTETVNDVEGNIDINWDVSSTPTGNIDSCPNCTGSQTVDGNYDLHVVAYGDFISETLLSEGTSVYAHSMSYNKTIQFDSIYLFEDVLANISVNDTNMSEAYEFVKLDTGSWTDLGVQPLQTICSGNYNSTNIEGDTWQVCMKDTGDKSDVGDFFNIIIPNFDSGNWNLSIGGTNPAPSVSNVLIEDTTLNTQNYLKDTDNVTITADVSDLHLFSGDTQYIELDATSLGKGSSVNPDNYDGTTATWILTNIDTSSNNGEISVTVSAEDLVGNSNSASDTINVDNTPTVCSISSITQANNPEYQHYNSSESKFYFNSEVAGEFIFNIDGADVTVGGFASGDKNASFPNIFTVTDGGDNTSGSDYSWTYNWDVSEDYSGETETITCYDNVLNENTTNVIFDRDTTSPSGIQISYPAGFTATTLDISNDEGTDSQSGINMSARYIERRNRSLENDECSGTWGSWNIVKVSPESNPWQDTFDASESNKCYMYRYRVLDRVNNTYINTSSDEVKVDSIAPSVEITYPTGGETVRDTISINWTSSDGVTSDLDISIEYRASPSNDWQVIESSLSNTGTYSWNTSTVEDSSSAQIRINSTDSVGNENSSISGQFIIANNGPAMHDILINTTNVSGPSEQIQITYNVTRTGETIEDCWVGLILYNGTTNNYTASQIGNNEVEVQCTFSTTISQVGNFTFVPYVNDSYHNTVSGTSQEAYRWDHVSIEHIYGDDERVNRAGSENIGLTVRVYDTDTGQYVHQNLGFTAADTCLYVTTDGSSYTTVTSNQDIDSLSYSNITFNPSTSYAARQQKWRIGTCNGYTDFYQDVNSSEFILDIYENVTHTWNIPAQGTEYSVGDDITFGWDVLELETGSPISTVDNTISIRLNDETNWTDITPECSVNDEGSGIYNCTWDSLWYSGGTYDVKINSSKNTTTQRYNNNPTIFDDRFTLKNSTNDMFLETSYASQRLNLTEIPATVTVNFNLTNEGNNTNYFVNLTPDTEEFGFNINQDDDWAFLPETFECNNMSSGETCSGSFNVTIPASENQGTKILAIVARWHNPDNTSEYYFNYSQFKVPSISWIEMSEESFIETINHSQTFTINFTVNNVGNTKSEAIYNISEGDLISWSKAFSPEDETFNLSGVGGAQESMDVSLEISVPDHLSAGSYWGNLSIFTEDPYNSESSEINITDYGIINITVPQDRRWSISTQSLSSTVQRLDNYNIVANLSPRGDDAEPGSEDNYDIFELDLENLGNNDLDIYPSQLGSESISPSNSGIVCYVDNMDVSLTKGTTETVTYSCAVPSTTTPGEYNGTIQIGSNPSDNAEPFKYEINLTINVEDLPPSITNESLSSDIVDLNFEAVNITAHVLDHVLVSDVWANVTYVPNSSNTQRVNMTPINLDYEEDDWRGSFIPTEVDDYTIVIYAEDGSGLVSSSDSMTLSSAKESTIQISLNDSEINIYNISQTESKSFQVRINLTGSTETDEGAGYFSNLTTIPGSGAQEYNWSFLPEYDYYGTIKEGTEQSTVFLINVSEGTVDGEYSPQFCINWTRPINDTVKSCVGMSVNVISNPLLDINDTINSDIQIAHGNSENVTIPLHSIGNDIVEDISLECISGPACSAFNFTFNESNFNINESEDKNITLTISVDYGSDPVTYSLGKIKATGQGNISDTFKLYITVPTDRSWTYTPNPESFNKTVGLDNSGELGTITINNSGNADIPFTITEAGTGTDYISESNTSFTISKRNETDCTLRNVTVYYNASGEDITSYDPEIVMSASGGSPAQDSFSFMLKILNLSVDLLEPVQGASEISGVYANTSLTGRIKSEAFVEGVEVDNLSNIRWDVHIEDSAAEVTDYYWTGGIWIMDIITPFLPDGETYDVKTTVHYTNLSADIVDAQASETTQNSLTYLDITSPVVENLTYDSVEADQTATVSADCSDNIGIDHVAIEVVTPTGTSYVDNMSFSSGNTYNYSFSNTSNLGDYNYTVTCYDRDPNLNTSLNDSASHWFEVYYNVTLNVTSLELDNSPANATYKMKRPVTEEELLNFTIDPETGTAQVNAHKRTYDVEIEAYDSEITFRSVDIQNDTEYNIPIDSIGTSDLAIENVTEIMSIHVEPNMSYSNAEITFNYSGKTVDTEDDIQIYKCDEWDTINNCTSGWELIDESSYSLNKVNNTISTVVSDFSVYAIGESEFDYIPGNDTQDNDTQETVTPSTGGGGGGSSSSYIPQIDDILLQTYRIEKEMRPGEEATDSISISNVARKSIDVEFNITGDIDSFVYLDNYLVTIPSGETKEAEVKIRIPTGTSPGLYTGKITVKFGGTEKIVPVNIEVLRPLEKIVDISLDLRRDYAYLNESFEYKVGLFNKGNDAPIEIVLSSYLYNKSNSSTKNNSVVFMTENISLESSYTGIKKMKIPADLPEGEYILEVAAEYAGTIASSSDFVMVTKERKAMDWIPYEYREKMFEWRYLIIGVILAFILGVYFTKKYYTKQKKKNPFTKPNIKALPKAGVCIGKVATSTEKVFLTMRDLTMHSISVGSTGAGKTVVSQVIVEEALKQGVNVLVLDPTAQWTGFLRKNEDTQMFNQYESYGLKKGDARSFDGNIRAIENPEEKIDITPYLQKKKEGKEGFIQIFSLHKLKYKEMSKFIEDMIQQVFDANLEERNSADTLIVFDEVHRLLERFGGSPEAQKQLERGVREFRKWGIGIVMISQVISDFNREVLANIGTKVQMRTRDKKDLMWIKTQYGIDYVRNIVRTKIGRGMLQNAEYNNGTPFFVDIRPLLHSPHRLTNEELKKYEDYNKSIIAFDDRLKELEKSGQDVFDAKTTLNLAKKNLMKGKFDMVDIYLEELKDKVK